ncbi:prepilin-type N-terminal cleavage/methylation domain-containing protein [Fusibacter sp. JL298sf-3]
MNKRKKGVTLIEVIVALALMSFVLVAYITVFAGGFRIVSEGKAITQETFDYQAVMEKALFEHKIDYDGYGASEETLGVFDGAYASSVKVKRVKTVIQGSRAYTGFVSSVLIKEPAAPSVSPFTVDVYRQGTDTRAFPWYDDAIELRAYYGLGATPTIFQNRTRWYASLSADENPYFPSGFEAISESISEEPAPGLKTDRLLKTATASEPDKKIEAGRYYHFEARPYTLAGKLSQHYNEPRLLVLNRAGTTTWQNFFEDLYFERAHYFRSGVYAELFNDRTTPTLNLDWLQNKDPEGALVGVAVPSAYSGKSFKTSVALTYAPLVPEVTVGSGIGLVDADNNGVMVSLVPSANQLAVTTVENGAYKATLYTANMLTTDAFDALKVSVDGSAIIDWSGTSTLELAYDKAASKLSVVLAQTDATGSRTSETVEIELQAALTPTYVGLKGYSGLDYIKDQSYEIYGRYDRNFAVNYKNIAFDAYSGGKDDVFKYIVYAPNALSVQHGFSIDGGIYAVGDLAFDPAKASVKGDVVSKTGNIVIKGAGANPVIEGSIYAPEGTVDLTNGGGIIDGSIHAKGNIDIGSNWEVRKDAYTLGRFTGNAGSSKIIGEIHSLQKAVLHRRFTYGALYEANDPRRRDPDFSEIAYTPPVLNTIESDTRIRINGPLELSANQTHVLESIDSAVYNAKIRLDLTGTAPLRVYLEKGIDLRNRRITFEIKTDSSAGYQPLSAFSTEALKTLSQRVYWEMGEHFWLGDAGSEWVGAVVSKEIDLNYGGMTLYGAYVALERFGENGTLNTAIIYAPYTGDTKLQ